MSAASPRYLAWCRGRGMLADKVALGPSRFDGMRGLLAGRRLNPGEVVCTVPFAATLSAETPPLDVLPPSAPTYVHVHRLFAESRTPRAVDPVALQLYYLGAVVAHMTNCPAAVERYGPYLETLTPPPARNDDALEFMSEADHARLRTLEQHADVAARGIAELGRRLEAQRRRAAKRRPRLEFLDGAETVLPKGATDSSGKVPTSDAIAEGIQAVLSRAVSLPRGCASTAPEATLPQFWAKAGENAAVTAALVPLIDMANAPRPGQRCNATLYTCGTGRRQLIAMVATAPIAEGDELLLPYNTASPAENFFRWGFVQMGETG